MDQTYQQCWGGQQESHQEEEIPQAWELQRVQELRESSVAKQGGVCQPCDEVSRVGQPTHGLPAPW